MLFTIVSAALLAISPAYAAPPQPPAGHPPYHGHRGPWATGTVSAPSAAQTPFKFPLANGFPNIQNPSKALNQIQKQAHGTLPNGQLPDHLASADITSFEAIVSRLKGITLVSTLDILVERYVDARREIC